MANGTECSGVFLHSRCGLQWVALQLLLKLALRHPQRMEAIWNTVRQLHHRKGLLGHCLGIPDHQTAAAAAAGALVMHVRQQVAVILAAAQLWVLKPTGNVQKRDSSETL